MKNGWLIAYTLICLLVALAWTLALVKDILTSSWLVILSGSQAFLMWLVVVDGLGVLLGFKSKSGFNDGQDD